MSKYDILTKYISMDKSEKFGEWIIDRENDGTAEHPMHMPFVDYSEEVFNFIDDVYSFEEKNKDMGLSRYRDILEENNIQRDTVSMKKADISSLNEQCVMALIIGVVRAERFCDGVLLDFFKSGYISKWLKRLNDFE